MRLPHASTVAFIRDQLTCCLPHQDFCDVGRTFDTKTIRSITETAVLLSFKKLALQST